MEQIFKALLEHALPIVLSMVAAFLIPVARRYAGLLKDEQMRRVVQAAILEVEEITRASGSSIKGIEKLDHAVATIVEKVPGISEAEAQALVHQELPKVRAAIADFAKATARAALTSPTQ